MAQKTDAEIEEERQRALTELDKDASAKFAPGTMGCHEALHAAYMVQEIVDSHLLTHPAIVLNPGWYRRASRASAELAALYQDIGSAHPPDRKA